VFIIRVGEAPKKVALSSDKTFSFSLAAKRWRQESLRRERGRVTKKGKGEKRSKRKVQLTAREEGSGGTMFSDRGAGISQKNVCRRICLPKTKERMSVRKRRL